MILSKLFPKQKQETKMSMTELLLSNSDSGSQQGLVERPGAGRIRNNEKSDRYSEQTDKSIIHPANGNVG